MFATVAMLEIFQQYIADLASDLQHFATCPRYQTLAGLHDIERDCTGALEFIALIRREQAETAAALALLPDERRAA